MAIGDDHQILIDIHQLHLHTLRGLNHHTAGHTQGPVHPCGHDHAAVALGGQTDILVLQLAVLLDLEGGSVGVAGGHHEALGLALRQTEGDQRCAMAGDVILAAGHQIPLVAAVQMDVAIVIEQTAQIVHRVEHALGRIQKIHQPANLFIHYGDPQTAENRFRSLSTLA